MNAAQKRAFAYKWLGNRETLFSDEEQEPPSSARVVNRWELRQADVGDIDDLVDLENRCFSTDLLTRADFKQAIADGVVLVIEADGKLVGAAVVLFESYSWLFSLAVAPECRGKGYAWRLLRAAESEARSRRYRTMRLEVREHNFSAISLYCRAGFRNVGRIASYYEDGADAIVFERALPPMSPGNPNYSSNNLILDGRIRIAPDPRCSPKFVLESNVWSMWGRKWNKTSGTWGELQLFHCKQFEMEDEPI